MLYAAARNYTKRSNVNITPPIGVVLGVLALLDFALYPIIKAGKSLLNVYMGYKTNRSIWRLGAMAAAAYYAVTLLNPFLGFTGLAALGVVYGATMVAAFTAKQMARGLSYFTHKILGIAYDQHSAELVSFTNPEKYRLPEAQVQKALSKINGSDSYSSKYSATTITRGANDVFDYLKQAKTEGNSVNGKLMWLRHLGDNLAKNNQGYSDPYRAHGVDSNVGPAWYRGEVFADAPTVINNKDNNFDFGVYPNSYALRLK